MLSKEHQSYYFIAALGGLCLFYFGFELFYNSYAMLAVDEFWFAHRIFQYKDGLPYRDFAPYKTVLGYYLLLPTLLTHATIAHVLIQTKNAIAALNALIFFSASLWLSRFFSRSGILVSLAALVSSELVLSYSSQIRVDLLGYWFCFFSLLFLLENRYVLAGLLMGLGFATTQKAIWYIFAANCAWGVQWLMLTRDTKSLRNIILFNCTTLGIIGAYLLTWAQVSSWDIVSKSVFGEAAAMYQLDWYDNARLLFWENITLYNPLLFLLAPVTIISIGVTYIGDKYYAQRLFVVSYATTILLCLIPYKQVFPYYMQVTIPIFFTLYAAFFSWLFAIFTPSIQPRLKVDRFILWAALLVYLIFATTIIALLNLPYPYLFICLIPISLVTYVTNHKNMQQQMSSLFFSLSMISVIFMGIIYPCTLIPVKMNYLNNSYQQAHITAIDKLLADGSDYVAGIELIYNKTQPINGIRHLMGPAIDFLREPTAKLRTVMLASLYEDPNATINSVIKDLGNSQVKFYVNNYRIMELAPPIKNYLNSQYEHFWGSIYLYSPVISNGNEKIKLKFSGNYQVEAKNAKSISLNGQNYVNGARIQLQKGSYQSSASHAYRLKLTDNSILPELDPHYQNDAWDKVIF